jgi:hypothetical protein
MLDENTAADLSTAVTQQSSRTTIACYQENTIAVYVGVIRLPLSVTY